MRVSRPGLLIAVLASASAGCVATVVGQSGAASGPEQSAAASRADAALTADVKARLAAEPTLAAGAIDVEAVRGVVTLRGRVPSSAQRSAAERAARGAPGVKAVISELEVK